MAPPPPFPLCVTDSRLRRPGPADVAPVGAERRIVRTGLPCRVVIRRSDEAGARSFAVDRRHQSFCHVARVSLCVAASPLQLHARSSVGRACRAKSSRNSCVVDFSRLSCAEGWPPIGRWGRSAVDLHKNFMNHCSCAWRECEPPRGMVLLWRVFMWLQVREAAL